MQCGDRVSGKPQIRMRVKEGTREQRSTQAAEEGKATRPQKSSVLLVTFLNMVVIVQWD